ncbi:AMP-binding protein [Nocardia aurantia]|uniref:Long-chain-fatty-acid--AMP ligase FadD26 n=1 Tax=Nocardia aurantia TaxID=2585199 RepID=A0A7K0DNT0_9NOCA|nr:AMP-binding protein [Nocardia aurantia]MQY27379.1 Long-chain-fatty-acid--AMP ligase FadD26 [Nocardia aurantia]
MNSSESDGTLPSRLAGIAEERPEVSATFWSLRQSLSYADLHARSVEAAAALVRRGVRRGEPVGILSPNAPEFLIGLFAVTAAGGAAAPLPLPSGAQQLRSYPQRLAAIAAASGMRSILVSPRLAGPVAALTGAVDVEFIDTTTLFDEHDDPVTLPAVGPGDPAIVQFTSGSTAAPKGVLLTHRNALAGLAAIRRGIALDRTDQGGFWLPLFHDMGLFGTLSAILRGIPAHLWSPTSFVKDPARWLREFAEAGVTITAMPSFGYQALLDAVPADRATEYDLRHWRIAFNGAEPISQPVVREFCARFGPAGFAPTTMFGVYGMAEATLAVTFPPLHREPHFEWVDREPLGRSGRAVPVPPGSPGARAIAGVGYPVAGMRLRLVEPESGLDVLDGTVGEILLRGDSVTGGYLTADPDVADRLFTDGWLRTGDLGYRRDGELFITGRLKEMITVRGENHYALDIEAAVEGLDGIYRGRCIAVADPERDAMAVVVETDRTAAEADALTEAVRARITAELGLAGVRVYPVPPRTIPRTSSGKLQRLAARELISNGSVALPLS